MIGNASQNYIVMLLFLALFSGPVRSVALNSVESIRVIGCSLTLTFDHLKERARLLVAPVVEVFSSSSRDDMGSMKEDLAEIQKMVIAIKEEAEFSRNFTDLTKISPKTTPHREGTDKSEILNDIQERLIQIYPTKAEEIVDKSKELLRNSKVELDGEKLALRASIDTKTLRQLLKANMSGSIEDFNMTKIIYENCLSIFRGAKAQCDVAVDEMRQSCVDSVGFLLSSILCSPTLFAVDSICPWLLDQVIDEKSICNSMQTSMINKTIDTSNMTGGADINSVYKNLTEQLASMNDDIIREEENKFDAPQRLELNISINDETLKLLLKTRDLWLFITDKYKWRKAFYDILLLLYELYTTFTFLCILMQAISYQRNYLNNITFDNYYVTGMFRALDNKRRLLRKEVVLPLTRDESERYISTFTCRRRTNEEKKTQKASCTVIALFMAVALSILYVDDIFHSILQSIHGHALIRYHEFGHHELKVNVKGDGPLARVVRRIATHLNSTYDLDKFSTTKQCLPQPESTSMGLYVRFFYLVFAYVFIDQIGIYAMRLRRVTAAFFYTEKEEQRIAYLYNLILRNRRRLERDRLSTLNADDDDDDNDVGTRDKNIFTLKDAVVYIKNCACDSICRKKRQ